MVLLMLGALGCDSCIGLDLQLAADLFVRLGSVLLLLLVSVVWIVCVSGIKRAKRRMDLAPSRLRLGLCRASGVLGCGVPSWLLGVFIGVVLEFPTEVNIRVCLRLARLVCVRLAGLVDSLALLRRVGAGEGVKGLCVSK